MKAAQQGQEWRLEEKAHHSYALFHGDLWVCVLWGKSNAEALLAALTNHDRLVQALADAIQQIEEGMRGTDRIWRQRADVVMAQARPLLAAMKGQPANIAGVDGL